MSKINKCSGNRSMELKLPADVGQQTVMRDHREVALPILCNILKICWNKIFELFSKIVGGDCPIVKHWSVVFSRLLKYVQDLSVIVKD